jgi:two-component system response regulator QseB
MHLLIIEDDLDLGHALQQSLKAEGITSSWLRRCADVPFSLNEEPIDGVLLDVALPDGSGMALLQRWRREGCHVPVIMITARSALQDRLDGLDGGADDFVIKPFAMPELLSRIRAVMRRTAQQASEVWSLGRLEIEPRRRVARLGGRPLDLSQREFDLLLELAREAGSVVPKALIAQRLAPLGDPLDYRFDRQADLQAILLAMQWHANALRHQQGLDGDLMVALQSVLGNLIDNAIKYGRDGGRIVVTLIAQAGELVLTVSDDGPGIPPERREQVFDRFVRGGQDDIKGTGLGLAIVQQGTRRLRGGVRLVAGIDGQGVGFEVRWPAQGSM